MKDYKILIKVKNNYMLKAMEAAGVSNASELSRLSKVSPSEVGFYLNLKKSPILTDGTFATSVKKIAEVLDRLPEDLFPAQHLRVPLRKNTTNIELDQEEMIGTGYIENESPLELAEASIMSDNIQYQLRTLTPKEEDVMKMRHGIGDYDEHTLDAIAKKIDLTRERVRQIEAKALRKLRHPGPTIDDVFYPNILHTYK